MLTIFKYTPLRQSLSYEYVNIISFSLFFLLIQVKLAYSDKLNASSYMPMIKTLARSLQVNVNYQKLKTVVEKRFEAARSMSKLINNIHPATLFAIKQFYEPHLDDTRRIFSLFSQGEILIIGQINNIPTMQFSFGFPRKIRRIQLISILT